VKKRKKEKKRLHTAVTTLSGEPNFHIRKKKNQFKLFSTSENKTTKKEVMYHLLRIIFIVRHTGR
jgi:hypothetical protein